MDSRFELLFRVTHDPSEVFAALSSRYTVVAGPSRSERWTLLDTADWRLRRAGMTLQDRRHGRAGELVLSVDGRDTVTAASAAGKWPQRADRLAPSPVRDRVAPAIGVRALLPVASVNVRHLQLQILDELAKTRVRAQIGQQRLAEGNGGPLPMWVSLHPLRGYEPDARRCAELLTARLDVLDGDTDPAAVTLAAAGLSPDADRFQLLDPLTPAANSIAAVLLGHLATIEANRAGVQQDVDVEFLHELRTAVRATRSILVLMGDLLPGTSATRFADEFAWLGRLTTAVRDLDVLLLDTAGYGALDIDALPDLDAVRDLLTRRRRQALRPLRAGLAGTRMTRLVGEWRALLNGLVTADLVGASTAEVAAARTADVYRRIAKGARGVDARTPADELHGLRHRCKRMRYLVDGFRTIYDESEGAIVLKRLKAVQDALGIVQDCDVQRAYLTDLAGRLPKADGRAASDRRTELIMTIGALRDRVTGRERRARSDLPERLADFCGARMRRRVDALGQAAR